MTFLTGLLQDRKDVFSEGWLRRDGAFFRIVSKGSGRSHADGDERQRHDTSKFPGRAHISLLLRFILNRLELLAVEL
jgi:hypothetical protein